MSGPSDYGGNNMKYHGFIASRTKRVEVDNRLSIKLYYRMASNLLKQVFLFDNLCDVKFQCHANPDSFVFVYVSVL